MACCSKLILYGRGSGTSNPLLLSALVWKTTYNLLMAFKKMNVSFDGSEVFLCPHD